MKLLEANTGYDLGSLEASFTRIPQTQPRNQKDSIKDG